MNDKNIDLGLIRSKEYWGLLKLRFLYKKYDFYKLSKNMIF